MTEKRRLPPAQCNAFGFIIVPFIIVPACLALIMCDVEINRKHYQNACARFLRRTTACAPSHCSRVVRNNSPQRLNLLQSLLESIAHFQSVEH